MKPTFFATPADFRAWLAKHHADRDELLVGFHRTTSGRPSITWQQSVDEALCFGWIDGVRKRIDEHSYTIRFSPRRAASKWSAINIRRATELEKEGRMTPAGLAEFAKADRNKADYSYEQRREGFLPELEAQFKKHRNAWAFFIKQAPSYQRLIAFWCSSAKKEETRQSRLQKAIAASEAGKRL